MTTDALSTLYDHYKDTCGIIGEASRRRDRLMLWALGAVALFAFEIFFPTPAEQLFSDLLARQLRVDDPIDVGLVGNIIWIALLLFSVRYYQASAYVERQYTYLHALENRVNDALGSELITREGKSYLADYPKFQSWLAFLYQKALPALLLLLPTCRIALEIYGSALTIPLVIDLLVYGLFVWSTLRYLQMVHQRKKT